MSWSVPLVVAASTLVLGVGVILAETEVRLPGNHAGYEPEQPIHFSHRIHAGELELDCLFCHTGAERSRHAGVPNAELCMGCHKHVNAGFDAVLEERQAAKTEEREPERLISPELRKLYDAMGLGDDLEPDPSREPRPIEWVRVHQIPDYVYFDHRVHVARDLACEQCHGPVRSMERIRQESDLSMGWCVDCHRSSPAEPGAVAGALGDPEHVSIDCARCHY
jgi:cytochrome c7-like protein